jgi:hypothetical protein
MFFEFATDALAFFTPLWGTLITAAFGAFAGAWASSRRETKRAVFAELNNINAARALCFSISNKFLSLKQQHILPLHRDYYLLREEIIAAQEAARRAPPQTPLEVRMDLQVLTPIWLPIETLERLVFEKISIRGRALVAAVDMVGAIDALEKSIAYRTALIGEFGPSMQQSIEKYFGLPANGRVDERFETNVRALYVQTDDCIFFSRILGQDLFDYGSRLRQRNARWYRLRVPKLTPENWALAEAQGLLPHREKYKSWLNGFISPVTRTARLRSFAARWLPKTSRRQSMTDHRRAS